MRKPDQTEKWRDPKTFIGRQRYVLNLTTPAVEKLRRAYVHLLLDFWFFDLRYRIEALQKLGPFPTGAL